MSYNPYQQTPTAPGFGQSNTRLAMEKVKTPAILLIISGVIGILVGLFGGGTVAGLYLGLQDQMLEEMEKEGAVDPELTPEMMKVTMDGLGWSGVAVAVFGSIAGVLSIVAGVLMMKLRGWGVALTAAILSLVPCIQGCCLFSIPVGIYAIVVLCDSQVKSAFK